MSVEVIRPDVPGCVWREDASAVPLEAGPSVEEMDAGACPLPRQDVVSDIATGCAPVRGGPVALRVEVTNLEPRAWVQLSSEGALAGDGVSGRADESGVYTAALERTVGAGDGVIVVEARNERTQRVLVMPADASAQVRRVTFLSIRGGTVRHAIDVCSRAGPEVRLRASVGEIEGAGDDRWARREPVVGGPCADRTAHSRFVWNLEASDLVGASPTSMELASDGVSRLVDIPVLADAFELEVAAGPIVSWSRGPNAREGSVTVGLSLVPSGTACSGIAASGIPVFLTPPGGASVPGIVAAADENGSVRFVLTVPNDVSVVPPFRATVSSPFGTEAFDLPPLRARRTAAPRTPQMLPCPTRVCPTRVYRMRGNPASTWSGCAPAPSHLNHRFIDGTIDGFSMTWVTNTLGSAYGW